MESLLPQDREAARRRQGLALAALLILLAGIAIGAALFRRSGGSAPLVQSASEGAPAAASLGRAFAPRGADATAPAPDSAGVARLEGRWETAAPLAPGGPRDRLLVAPEGRREELPMAPLATDGFVRTGAEPADRRRPAPGAQPETVSGAAPGAKAAAAPTAFHDRRNSFVEATQRLAERKRTPKELTIKTDAGEVTLKRRDRPRPEAGGARTTETGVNAIQGGDGFKIMDGVPKSLRE